MKHHFGDFLDRDTGLWTITPNCDRWQHHHDDLSKASPSLSKLTLTKNDKNWERALAFDKLVELTLDNPSKEQLAALPRFLQLRALRISHARPPSIVGIERLENVRELVLEYVSGVKDLAPLGRMPALEALHLENLRGVADFSGLGASSTLRYLSIDGTFDWSQPIDNFDFLESIQSLQYIRLMAIRAPKQENPLASLAALSRLSKLSISMNAFPLEVFAWLHARLPEVEGAVRPAYKKYGGESREISSGDLRSRISIDEFARHPALYVGSDGKRYEFVPYQALLLGKGERHVSGTKEAVDAKCEAHENKFRRLIDAAR